MIYSSIGFVLGGGIANPRFACLHCGNVETVIPPARDVDPGIILYMATWHA